MKPSSAATEASLRTALADYQLAARATATAAEAYLGALGTAGEAHALKALRFAQGEEGAADVALDDVIRVRHTALAHAHLGGDR